jgi:V/A-type H+-transporting ATPase subunit D
MQLLATRGRLGVARTGEALLEQKREALLRELYRQVRIVFTAQEDVESAAAAARLALEAARVRLGPETVAAAATAAKGEVAVELTVASVMGVPVPVCEPRSLVRAPAERGRAPEASGPALELAAERFEEELTLALRLANMESRVRRLAREIRRTSSRVNALRTRVIPELDAEARAISFVLEQREREDHHRLKSVKRLRSSAR